MPRPIFRELRQEVHQGPGLRTDTRQQAQEGTKGQAMDQMQLDRLLRKPRSKEFMETMHSLDSGGRVRNQEKVKEIMDAMRQEFPEADISGIFLGVVSKCYLGKPYEVHSLDMTGEIIEHYKLGETMPCGLEKARGIALCGSYEFVEVYIDCCRAVSANGSVSVIR